MLQLGKAPHSGVWTRTPAQGLPLSLVRLFDLRTLNQINAGSSLIAAVLAVLLIATAPEEFGCRSAPTPWRLQDWKARTDGASYFPTARVSLLTYKAIVAVRYPELVLHEQDPIQIGHFVAHDHTVEYGGFRTVLWDAPKDLLFFPSNAFMASTRSLHTFNCSKKMNCDYHARLSTCR